MQLPTTMTAIRELLTYYKWDEQRLIGEYFEYENDPAAFFQQAKVANPFNIPPPAATNNSTDCEICCSGVSPDVSSDKKIPLFCLLKTKHTFFPTQDLYSLECGHKYCKSCWEQYITTKIVDDGLNQTIACLQPDCVFLVDDENIVTLINDPEVIVKYQQAMTNTFVQVFFIRFFHISIQNCAIEKKLLFVFSIIK